MNPASPAARAIVIGADGSEQLSVHVTRREFPEASDYWDGNWVYATIQIRAGAFRGEYEALLRTDELASFRDQLATLHAALNGCATFETMEHWLRVDIQGDGRGHFLAKTGTKKARSRMAPIRQPTAKPFKSSDDARRVFGRARGDGDALFPAPPPKSELPHGYVETQRELKAHIQQTRLRTVLAANAGMTRLYWDLGRTILDRQAHEGWERR